MFELKVKTHFAAAHKLKMVGQKCENLHGHNWNIEVYVCGENLNPAGVLVDFGDIKKAVKDIMGELDHKYLNEIDIFTGIQPSSEQIAIYIAKSLQSYFNVLKESSIRVSKVSAWESEDSCASFIPPVNYEEDS